MRLKNKLFWIYLVNAAIYFIQGIEGLPSLALFIYLKEKLGFTPEKIMYITSLISIGWVIKPLWGFLCDKFLSKKRWILISLLGSILVSLYFGLSFWLTLPLIILVAAFGNVNTALRDSSCVLPDTLILTQTGLKYIKHIKIGELVLTHLNRWQKVKKIFIRDINERIYCLNNELYITANHPILISKYKKCIDRLLTNLRWEWKNITELSPFKEGVYNIKNEETFKSLDYITLTKKPLMDFRSQSNIPEIIKVTKEMLITIGFFLGDGCCVLKETGGSVCFYFGWTEKDREAANAIITFLKQIGCSYRTYRDKACRMTKIYVGSKQLGGFFSIFYNEGKEKILPLQWLNVPIEQFKYIVYGFYLADGCCSFAHGRKRSAYIYNTSLKLLNQIKVRCEFSGIYCILRLDRVAGVHNILGRVCQTKDYYTLSFGNNTCKRIFDFIVETKNNSRADFYQEILYYILKPIKNIFDVSYKGKVYNLEVEKDNSYIANGNILHNCDGLMCVEGKKTDSCSTIQAIQWISITLAGIIVGLGGGYIAQHFNYKVAYLSLIPIYLIILAIISQYKGTKTKKNKKSLLQNIVSYKVLLTDKKFLLCALFLFLYKFSPSFGTPLLFIERDVFKWSAQWLGTLGAIISCFEILGAIVFYKYCKKLPIKKFLYISVFLGASTGLAYLYFTPVSAIVYGIVFSVIGMFIHLTMMSFLAKATIKGKEATSFALLCSVNNFAAGTASSFTGAFLLPLIGLPTLIVISSLTSFLCLPVLRKIDIK